MIKKTHYKIRHMSRFFGMFLSVKKNQVDDNHEQLIRKYGCVVIERMGDFCFHGAKENLC